MIFSENDSFRVITSQLVNTQEAPKSIQALADTHPAISYIPTCFPPATTHLAKGQSKVTTHKDDLKVSHQQIIFSDVAQQPSFEGFYWTIFVNISSNI